MKYLLLVLFPFALCGLTLEQKVGQLFMVYFEDDDCAALIEQAHVGGIIYYQWANDLESPESVRAVSERVQQLAGDGPPLLIAIDQEGGRVSRLGAQFPTFAAAGQMETLEQVHETSLAIGKTLLDVGINMNLAPVVDVNSNPDNPVIGDRSFGADPEWVAACGEAALFGYGQANIACSLKHFPGYGDVTVDPHYGLPVIDKDLRTLDAVELVPFKRLAPVAPAIMTAHLFLPQIDPDRCATLSPLVVHDLLRDGLGYRGVIITDSLTMDGVQVPGKNLGDLALEAFEAGHDILLIGGRRLDDHSGRETHVRQVLAAHAQFVEAVHTGRISMERLDASVDRILQMKNDFCGPNPQKSKKRPT